MHMPLAPGRMTLAATLFLLAGESGPAPARPAQKAAVQVVQTVHLVPPQHPGATVRADTFIIHHTLRGDRLRIWLQTDLPDATALMISVARNYRTNEDTVLYSDEYFSEKSTVGAWRHGHVILLDNAKWRATLADQQRLLARAGEPFTVRSVSQDVELDFTVPINQASPLFQRNNANMLGRAVTREGAMHLVQKSAFVRYPLAASTVSRTRLAGAETLRPGHTYVLPKEVPLMPAVEPADPLAALAQVRQLATGTRILIRHVIQDHGVPWYRVEVRAGAHAGATGWINSTALLGQAIEDVTR